MRLHWQVVYLTRGIRPERATANELPEGWQASHDRDGVWCPFAGEAGEVGWRRLVVKVEAKAKAKRAKEKGEKHIGALAWVPANLRKESPDRFAHYIVEAIRQIRDVEQVDSARCKGDAGEVIKLWRSLGEPDLIGFVGEVSAVARAARDCPDPLFAHDVRSEHRPGVDRSRSVATLCVERRWSERLDKARAWAMSKGEPVAVEVVEDDAELPTIRGAE